MKEYEDIFNTNNSPLQNQNETNTFENNNADYTQVDNFMGYSDQVRDDLDINDKINENVYPKESIEAENVYPKESIEAENAYSKETIETENAYSKETTMNKEKNLQYKPMEHPDAKIVLNKMEESEEQNSDEEVENINIIEEFKSNKSLLFVLGIGILILVVIIAIPFISKFIGY